MVILAVDVGTSIIKTVAFAQNGQELACARMATQTLHPQPGSSEQSMEAVWAAVHETLTQVITQVQQPIRAITITSQGDGCWLVDESGNPAGNALLWNDGRAASIVETWQRTGVIARAAEISGSVTYPGLSNALLCWLDKHNPQTIARSRWVLSCNGWIFFCLTGAFAAEITDGSNPFCSLQQQGAYSDELFHLFDLSRHRALFPEIAHGSACLRSLTPNSAASLRLPEGTPAVMAPYDIVCTAFGAGVTGPGQACLILGTTICAEAVVAATDALAAAQGTTLALGDGTCLRASPTLAGCETLEWAARILGVQDLFALGELAHQAAPGSNGLLFLPYLAEAGERAPFLDPAASGSWEGLKLTHGREQMARSVYEGLCCVIRECLGAMNAGVREVRVAGGGASSDLWCQMIADTLGLDVLRPAATEVGARGAYLFCRVLLGDFASLAQAAEQLPTSATRFVPDPAKVRVYGELYREFLHLRNAVRPLWRRSQVQPQERH